MPIALAPIILVDGNQLSDANVDKLRGMRVHRAFGLVGRATLRFQDANYALAASSAFALWSTVRIQLPAVGPGRALTIFDGEVTGLSLDQGAAGSGAEVTVTADDPVNRLTRGSLQTTTLNQKLSDLVLKMCSTAGIPASVETLADPHPYLLQTGSPMALLEDIARRANLRWCYDPERGQMVVETASKPGAAGPRLTMGQDLRRFSVRFSGAGLPGDVSVTGYDLTRSEALQGQAKVPTPRQRSAFVPPEVDQGSATPPKGGNDLLLSGLSPTTKSEADRMADARRVEGAAGAVTARGALDGADGTVAPGVVVTVEGAGPSSGSYLVSEVEHLFDADGLRTTFTAGSHRPATMVDLLQRPVDDAGFSRDKLVVGIVSDNADPTKKGRVKVKFAVSGTAKPLESEWARMLTPDAGKDRGFVFLPEVGDEVLVAFEHGDTRRPIVLGGIFSSKNTLPSKDSGNVANGKVNHRRITSRTGHYLEFDDSSGKEQILLVHKAGPQVMLQEKLIEVKGSNIPIKLTNGPATLELTDKGDIVITCNNLKIAANQNVEIQGLKVDTKASTSASLEGTTGVNVKGTTVSVDGQGMVQIKGGMVKVN